MIKDTLTLYKELLASGCPESQANIQAEQLGAFGDSVTNVIKQVMKELTDIKTETIKTNKDMLWMRLIGAAMIVTFMGNVLFLALRG